MKLLEEYIKDSVLYNVLKNHLIYHIDIQRSLLDPVSHIKESLGKFNQCGKVAEYIFDEVRKTSETHLILDCKKFKTYFDSIDITIEYDNVIYGGYIGQENRIIYINLNIPEDLTYEHYDDFIFLVIHELMHGYEDKRRIKHGKPGIFNLLDDEYVKGFKMIHKDNEILKNIGRCKYFLNDQEINAYIGTLNFTIENLIKKNNITIENIDYDKLIDDIKDTKVFKDYFDLFKFIIKLNEDILSEYEMKELMDLYEHYYKNKKTIKEIKIELNKKWDKFYNKFNQIVPKIICKDIIKPAKRTYDII